ncbi:hypothetical protein PO124_02535 [Bacillus licheniformis]|nr:hypothetical protein [Bacillus licheniformis]
MDVAVNKPKEGAEMNLKKSRKNRRSTAWCRFGEKQSELKDEDYEAFYKEKHYGLTSLSRTSIQA